MPIYNDVITIKPYSYVLVDNKADTSVRRRQIVSDVFGSCVSDTLPGILGSRTIEPQTAESMNTNDGDVQSFPDQKLHADTKGIIPFSCPRMFSGESCLRCRVCFVCFEGWFFERVIKNIMPVYC